MKICGNVHCGCNLYDSLLKMISNGEDDSAEMLFDQIDGIHSDLSDYGQTAIPKLYLLHYAVMYGSKDIVQFLLRRGHSADDLNEMGETPVMLAYVRGEADIMQILLMYSMPLHRNGSNFFISLEDCINKALHLSRSERIRQRRTEFILQLFGKINDDSHGSRHEVVSLISNASENVKLAFTAMGEVQLARMLLRSYNVNYQETKYQSTALHLAILNARCENIVILLNAGADVDILDNRGDSALKLYMDNMEEATNSTNILSNILARSNALFLEREDGTNMDVEWLLQCGTSQTITTLLQTNIRVNQNADIILLDVMRTNGATSEDVQILIKNKHNDTLSILDDLRVPFDANAHASDGDTLLNTAIRTGSVRKVKFLLEHGADVNHASATGESSLWRAITVREEIRYDVSAAIVRLLLNHGAIIENADAEGNSLIDHMYTNRNWLANNDILAHVALLESKGQPPLTEQSHQEIASRAVFKLRLDLCREQLQTLKVTVVYGAVTLYKVLTEAQNRLKAYARNGNEMSNGYDTACGTIFELQPYYAAIMDYELSQALRRAYLEKEAGKAIGTVMGIQEVCYPVIVDKLLSYLNNSDLNNLLRLREAGMDG